MRDSMSDREILAKYGVVFDTSGQLKLSQFGGMKTVLEMLKKGRIRERLSQLFGETKARSILQLGLGILAGGRSLEDAYRVAQDPVIRTFVGNPVGAIELSRNFKAFTKSQLEEFHDWNRSLAILELAQLIPQSEELVFDVDATSVEKYGSQEGVEHGYVGTEQTEACYQFLFFRLHNLDTFFYGTIRAGSAHSQNGWTEYLTRFLPAFNRHWKICFRADSGYFNERAIDVFTENEARFFIKAAMSPSRQGMAQHSPDLVWIFDEKTQAEYASYVTCTEKGTKYREIYKRVKIASKAQLSLLESAGYRYDCLSTNDLVIGDAAAFAFYNGRANVENNIRELKNDWALGKIVTELFDANDAITQTTLLFYILLSHLKRTTFPDEMKRHQLSTLRTRLFNIPAGLFRGARRNWIRLQNVFAGEEVYARIYRKLNNLSSWVLAPPELRQAAT